MAIIWRVINPPAPIAPGPAGHAPHWTSASKLGDMGPWAMNPSGSMWAGAWNQTTTGGKLRSAVWVIDLESGEATNTLMKEGSQTSGISWADDNTVRALVARNSGEPEVVSIDAATGKQKQIVRSAELTATALAWPNGSDKIAEPIGSAAGRVVLLSGGTASKEVKLGVGDNAKFDRIGTISGDGSLFVFSVAEKGVTGNDTYYLADTRAGTSKRIFASADLPGRLDGLWVSPAGVLVVCSERDKFHEMIYNLTSGKMEEAGKAGSVDVAKSWPDAPKNMMFISYSGGYDFDLATAKTRQIMDLTKLEKSDDSWRSQVRDGRLYQRKDGSYTSVSVSAGEIDIRVIDKDGSKKQDILPRR